MQAAEAAAEARARAHDREVQRLAREGAQQRSMLQARVAELQVCSPFACLLKPCCACASNLLAAPLGWNTANWLAVCMLSSMSAPGNTAVQAVLEGALKEAAARADRAEALASVSSTPVSALLHSPTDLGSTPQQGLTGAGVSPMPSLSPW